MLGDFNALGGAHYHYSANKPAYCIYSKPELYSLQCGGPGANRQ